MVTKTERTNSTAAHSNSSGTRTLTRRITSAARELRTIAINMARTAGGALLRDRLFFFADYQGATMTQGVETGRIAVPSLANRSGGHSKSSVATER